uniref:Uncharacterized protein n=1 Tax=viral metagenome TaxID=1070528 RepID=A0A6C0DEF7_9ZZZZ
MSSKNQDSKWGSSITTVGFTIIIIVLLINTSLQIIKYFDMDISGVIVYLSFFIFMIACFFVLPKDIPNGLVMTKPENIQEQILSPGNMPSQNLFPSAPPKM